MNEYVFYLRLSSFSNVQYSELNYEWAKEKENEKKSSTLISKKAQG